MNDLKLMKEGEAYTLSVVYNQKTMNESMVTDEYKVLKMIKTDEKLYIQRVSDDQDGIVIRVKHDNGMFIRIPDGPVYM